MNLPSELDFAAGLIMNGRLERRRWLRL